MLLEQVVGTSLVRGKWLRGLEPGTQDQGQIDQETEHQGTKDPGAVGLRIKKTKNPTKT